MISNKEFVKKLKRLEQEVRDLKIAQKRSGATVTPYTFVKQFDATTSGGQRFFNLDVKLKDGSVIPPLLEALVETPQYFDEATMEFYVWNFSKLDDLNYRAIGSYYNLPSYVYDFKFIINSTADIEDVTVTELFAQ